jgi:hypothetical protein
MPATGLPNLVALTRDDGSWTWDTCLLCESANVTHRALWIRTTNDGTWEISRAAWCADKGCQGDRERSVNLIYVGTDGLTRASTAPDLPDAPMPLADYGSAWTELRGYVRQALDDGDQIDPTDLVTYMDELRHRALAPVGAWLKTRTNGKDGES